MCASGECFAVLSPNTLNSVIIGRNSYSEIDESNEVILYDNTNALEGKSDGGAEPGIGSDILRVILQKPQPGVWGGDCGANERKVYIAITWTALEAEKNSGKLLATDILRYALALSQTAADAIERIGNLVSSYGADNAKLNFIVADSSEVWAISCASQLWAATRLLENFKRFTSNGLTVTTTIDKSSDGLTDALKSLGVWSGEGDLNFAFAFDAVASTNDDWLDTAPTGDGSFNIVSMFKTLRASASDNSRSATVSVLPKEGIACHWFTATPNINESVFKPFVFAPNAKISPLTKVPNDSTLTLLHKLHTQRKATAVEDLKELEAACVDEVNSYLDENPSADEELDELMKDCVEAEVKFYR